MFEKARQKWGVGSQVNMLAEEASELSVASLHLNRAIKDQTEAWEKFAEEVADVEIMIDEMKQYFPVLTGKVNLYRNLKLQRLSKLLKEEGSSESDSPSHRLLRTCCPSQYDKNEKGSIYTKKREGEQK